MPDSDLVAVTSLISPFDISMRATEEGLLTMQSRISQWLSNTVNPVRFMAYTRPADLQPRIDYVSRQALMATNRRRKVLLREYRRFYEELQQGSNYQNLVAAIVNWVERGQNESTIARSVENTFQSPARLGSIPPLFHGRYKISPPNDAFRYWHMTPTGRPGGRKYWCLLVSHEFKPVQWNFFKPFGKLMSQDIELSVAIDVPKTFDRDEAISRLEQVMLAYDVHLSTKSDVPDSRSEKKMRDTRATLDQVNDGQGLHQVQVIIGVSGKDLHDLSVNVAAVRDVVKPFFGVRAEYGRGQAQAVRMFSNHMSQDIDMPQSPWSVVSDELALFFSPLGQRKMGQIEGVMRGEAMGGGYPVWFDSWDTSAGKKASHEIWVGRTGAGKTFAMNCYLTRSLTEHEVPFDILEPMGHTKLLADALGYPWYNLSSKSTVFNPLDPMYQTPIDQIAHVIRVVETMLGRTFAGSQRGNQEKAVLGQAVERLYERCGGMGHIASENAPTMEDLAEELYQVGDKRHTQQLAQALADEIGGLAAGAGPYASMLNGRTNVDLSFGKDPRLFSFKELNSDPVLLAIAYTQVLAAIRRDSLLDDSPRIIAVDEVYRLLRNKSLLDFMVEGTKTLRTQQKKLLLIDQQLSIFVDDKTDRSGKMRLVFENCPIRVIFNQREGLETLKNDSAFTHYHENHFDIIRQLDRGQFIFDAEGRGLQACYFRPSRTELARFGGS